MKYLFFALLLVQLCVSPYYVLGQSYKDLILKCKEKYANTTSLCGSIKLTSEKDNLISSSTKLVYKGNKNRNWRLIHLPDYHRYIFYDGHHTYNINDATKTYYIDNDTFALLRFRSFLDNISGIFMTSDVQSKGPDADTTSSVTLLPKGMGIVEIVMTLKDLPEYNISNFVFKMDIDTIRRVPLWENTSYLFLGDLVSETTELDTLYVSKNDVESAFQNVNQMIQAYKLEDHNSEEAPAENVFTCHEILKKIHYLNVEPGMSKYYLLDFYYVNCPPCLKSVSYLKDLYKEVNKADLSVIAINGYDTKEKIENYALKNEILYPEAMIDLEFLNNTVGHIAYPYFVLFDSQDNVIMKQTGFDPAFFEAVREFLNK